MLASLAHCVLLLAATLAALLAVRLVAACTLAARRLRTKRTIVGFLHPHCAGGGGGERVLWHIVHTVQHAFPQCQVVIYADAAQGGSGTLARVRDVFGIELPRPDEIEFVPLRRTRLIDPSRYPRLTMLFQNLGAVPLVLEALWKRRPDVLFDTTGLPFSYPAAWLLGSRVMCYTHYPTISTDMLRVVREQRVRFNNAGALAQSRLGSKLKLAYYMLFAVCYFVCGQCVSLVFVNSRWTMAHIFSLWRRMPVVLYPPCPVDQLSAMCKPKERKVLSVAQFRPEKNHELIVRAFADACKTQRGIRLVLVGGCRPGTDDERRVEALRALCAELGIADRVEFLVNAPFRVLTEQLDTSLILVHAMEDEHFGINVVEGMAAGAVVIAHRSGGPQSDIVAPGTGFLCRTREEYAAAMRGALEMPDGERAELVARARTHVAKFSDAAFQSRCRATLQQAHL